MDLNLEALVGQAEQEIETAENDLLAAVSEALNTASKEIPALAKAIQDELVVPLKESYAADSNVPSKLFLADIETETKKFNERIDGAKTLLMSAFSQSTFGVRYFLDNYIGNFDSMTITGLVTPITRHMFGQLHGGYSYSGNMKKNRGYMSGLGVIAVIPIAVTAVKAFATSKITDKIIEALMSFPQIQDAISKVVETTLSIYQGLYYFFRQDVKDRNIKVETRAKKLEKLSGYCEQSFSKITDAIQTLQDTISRRVDVYVRQIEQAAGIPETVPETATSNISRREQFIYNDPVARGAYAPYKIVEKIVDGKTIHERQYISGIDDVPVGFTALQHATRMLINKERFPYGK